MKRVSWLVRVYGLRLDGQSGVFAARNGIAWYGLSYGFRGLLVCVP